MHTSTIAIITWGTRNHLWCTCRAVETGFTLVTNFGVKNTSGCRSNSRSSSIWTKLTVITLVTFLRANTTMGSSNVYRGSSFGWAEVTWRARHTFITVFSTNHAIKGTHRTRKFSRWCSTLGTIVAFWAQVIITSRIHKRSCSKVSTR